MRRAILSEVSDELSELLHRQHEFLSRQQGLRLILGLRRYLKVLKQDPRLRALLEDLRSEADQALATFSAHQRLVLSKLEPLRRRFEELVPGEPTERKHNAGGAPAGPGPPAAQQAPEAQGSAVPAGDVPEVGADRREPSTANKPEDATLECATTEAYYSLSNWDATAQAIRLGPPPPLPGDDTVSPTDTLLHILSTRLSHLRFLVPKSYGVFSESDTDLRPDLADLANEVATIAGTHARVQRRLVEETMLGAAFALLRVQALVDELEDPPPTAPHQPRVLDWPTALLRQRFGPLAGLDVREMLHAPRRQSPRHFLGDEEQRLDQLVAGIREELDVLHEELRRRLGTTRSRLALIGRFRQRCQWYEYESLRRLVEADTRRAEDLLTRELVRFLFDHGLNPITKPLTGRLEPDVLDPSLSPSFYVEAKQYAEPARDRLLRGVWQAHETLANLARTQYEVREGFYIVFRLGGPRYSFPERIAGEGWSLYPVVIDLAPNVGSRGGRQALGFTVDELQPRPVYEGPPQTD